MADVFHALGLHLHEPLGNLGALHHSGEAWEACQVLWCHDRPKRMIEGYEDVARLRLIVRAYDHLLTAGTSCNFYWGSRWGHRSFDELEQVCHLLDTAMAKLGHDNKRL
jgi:hypothetical protein